VVFATGPRGMMAGIALFGAGNAGVQMMIWALLADAIDHGERRTGVRLEAVPVALLLLTLKLGGGIGGALFGQGLALAGWTGTAPLGETGSEQLLAMAWAMPVAGAVIGIAMLALQARPRESARPLRRTERLDQGAQVDDRIGCVRGADRRPDPAKAGVAPRVAQALHR